MEIIFVAAIGENGEMGRDNALLWHLPGDLPRFKELTIGSPIIMGRKTFESIGKALPNRTNIVLTGNTEWQAEDAVVCHSIDSALHAAKEENPQKISIIGGGEIYKLFLPYATKLEITQVFDAPDADTFFPNFSEDEFVEIGRVEVRETEPYFDYVTYEKK
ncbi:MAG: dihydrofolate reductase [Pseudomonadota bacterium]